MQTFAAVYEIDPVPSQAHPGLAFSYVGQDIIHGYLTTAAMQLLHALGALTKLL